MSGDEVFQLVLGVFMLAIGGFTLVNARSTGTRPRRGTALQMGARGWVLVGVLWIVLGVIRLVLLAV